MTRTWLERAGLVLAVLGVAAIGLEAHRLGPELWSGSVGRRFWGVIVAGAMLYGFLGFVLAEAWRRWLRAFAQREIPKRPAYLVYARTQVAKYLPGNVLHLVSRHVAARAWGVDHDSLVRAAVAEAGSLVLCSGGLAMGTLALGPERFHELPLLRFVAIWLLSTVVLTFLWRRNRLVGGGARPADRHARSHVPTVLAALVAYLVFFAVGGSLLWLLLRSTGQTEIGLLPGISAYALAWMAGFVVPGAPAGLGVREWVFLALLGPMAESEALLVSILGLRAITVLGDGLFVLYAGLSPGRSSSS